MSRSVGDSRDIAFAMPQMENRSSTDDIELVGASLIGSSGFRLVDAFTASMETKLAAGQPVPPRPEDWDDAATYQEIAANWRVKVPLAETVIKPGETRQVILVLRPESADDCLSVKGFTLRYRQNGRSHSVVSNIAAVSYYVHESDEEVGSRCESVMDDIMAHPLE